VLGLSIWKLAIIAGIVDPVRQGQIWNDTTSPRNRFKKGMAEDDSDPKTIGEKPLETVASPAKEKASG
jgi:hypothetical protein